MSEEPKADEANIAPLHSKSTPEGLMSISAAIDTEGIGFDPTKVITRHVQSPHFAQGNVGMEVLRAVDDVALEEYGKALDERFAMTLPDGTPMKSSERIIVIDAAMREVITEIIATEAANNTPGVGTDRLQLKQMLMLLARIDVETAGLAEDPASREAAEKRETEVAALNKLFAESDLPSDFIKNSSPKASPTDKTE